MKNELTHARNHTPAWLETLKRYTGPLAETVFRSGREYASTPDLVDLILDCSASMSLRGKLDFAKLGGARFAEEAWRSQFSVGLIRFSDWADRILLPQARNSHFRRLLEGLSCDGLTYMAKAIRLSTQGLASGKGERCMCIVTDGSPDEPEDTLLAAQEAKLRDISIMVIGTEDADWAFLRKLATRTNLAVRVHSQQLEIGIQSMAKLLPGPRPANQQLPR